MTFKIMRALFLLACHMLSIILFPVVIARRFAEDMADAMFETISKEKRKGRDKINF